MLADSAPMFSTENFLIPRFLDNNGLVWLKSGFVLLIHNNRNPTHNIITTPGTFLAWLLSCIWYNMTRKTCQKIKYFQKFPIFAIKI